MNASAHTLRRLASATGLVLALAALAIPTAQADQLDPAIATAIAANERVQVSGDLRSPDTQGATANAQASQLDPAIATAIAAHKRVQVSGDLRHPDTRDIATSLAVESPVTSPSDDPSGVNGGLLAVVLAAIGAMVIGVGVLAVQGGKGTRSVTTS